MHHLRTFFCFHHGTPPDRAVKVVGSFAMALTLALTATAMTTVTAAGGVTDDALHLASGCPTVDGPPEHRAAFVRDGARITWTTTAPAEENDVGYGFAFASPIVVRASGSATTHVATLHALSPGTTYRYSIRSRSQTTGAEVRSGTCALTTPGDDTTPPLVAVPEVLSTGSTEAVLTITADDGEDAWVTYEAPGIPARTSARVFPEPRSGFLAFTAAIQNLRPGTTYTAEAAVRDANGRVGRSTVVRFTTARSGADDANPPSIVDIRCAAMDGAIDARVTVAEIAARGFIEYEDQGAPQTVEASGSPTPDQRGTVLTRTVATADAPTSITIRAVVLDRTGNVARSDIVACQR